MYTVVRGPMIRGLVANLVAMVMCATPCMVRLLRAQKVPLSQGTSGEKAVSLRFEVASINASPGDIAGAANAGHIGSRVVGDRADFNFTTLLQLICTAYSIGADDVDGPEWIKRQRFDIHAKLPPGATGAQLPEMLRSLLLERFNLTVHRAGKPQDVFALVVAPTGHKLVASIPEGECDDPAQGKSGPGRGIARIDGVMTGVLWGRGPMGCQRVSVSGGILHLEYRAVTMKQLAQMLAPQLQRPVIDMTNLQGTYHVSLDISSKETLAASGRATPSDFAEANDQDSKIRATDPPSSSVFEAIQKLGLRLERRNAHVERLVIDHVEKAPTEN
jgi:uncharacterized protein (TIGR03435 family)